MKRYWDFDTMIIGGGQAGLSVSYHLKLEGRDHIVFEQAAQAANTWRNHRWDSFTLNNPTGSLGFKARAYQEKTPTDSSAATSLSPISRSTSGRIACRYGMKRWFSLLRRSRMATLLRLAQARSALEMWWLQPAFARSHAFRDSRVLCRQISASCTLIPTGTQISCLPAPCSWWEARSQARRLRKSCTRAAERFI